MDSLNSNRGVQVDQNDIDTLALCSMANALGFYEHHGYNKEAETFHGLPNGVELGCTKMRKAIKSATVHEE